MGTFSFFRSEKETLAVVLDVGSASVGGALVLYRQSEKPTVFYAVRRQFPFQQTFSFDAFTRDMGKILEGVIADLGRHGMLRVPSAHAKQRPDAVFCVLSTPWYRGKTQTIRIERSRPFAIDDALIEREIERASEESRAVADEAYSGAANEEGGGDHEGDAVILERHVMRTLVNRYAVSDPRGKRGRELSLSVFLSFAPQYVIDTIRERSRNVFPEREVAFHSYLFSFFTTVRDLWPQQDAMLLVDVSGEMTELGLVTDGVLRDIVSFPIGTHALLRSIAKAGRFSFAEARSLLSVVLQKKGHTDIDDVKKAEDALKEYEREFGAELRTALHSLSHVPFLYEGIFISADAPFAAWLNGLFRKETLAEALFASGDIPIHLFLGTVLAPHIAFESAREEDSFLAIDALFIKRILEGR